MLHKIRVSKYCLYLLVPFVCLSTLGLYHYLYNVKQFKFSLSKQSITIYPYIAVIIDDRASQKVVNAILNVLEHIPIDWKVQVFTHNEHWPFYQKSLLSLFISDNRVFMTPIDFPRKNMSAADYINLYLTSPALWRRIQGDKVLYFQIDAVICSNSSYKITDFLHYDFIGAPWLVGGCCNGGFSIRSRTKTLQLLESEQGRYPFRRLNEDGWFTNSLRNVGGIVAPISIAKTFSVETIYYPRSFAVHKPLLDSLGRENMDRICNECPETKTISNYCR